MERREIELNTQHTKEFQIIKYSLDFGNNQDINGKLDRIPILYNKTILTDDLQIRGLRNFFQEIIPLASFKSIDTKSFEAKNTNPDFTFSFTVTKLDDGFIFNFKNETGNENRYSVKKGDFGKIPYVFSKEFLLAKYGKDNKEDILKHINKISKKFDKDKKWSIFT